MIGKTIDGRYRIETAIGRGGMGSVYRALDLVEQRSVAVKILHQFFDTDTEAAFTRFQREFRVLARLDHPYIVQAYQNGLFEDIPYLVLEFLAGQTLKEELGKGPLPRSRLLLIAQQLCQALSYLHALGIVHRDLKPGNLMLLPPDDSVQVKLMDFGLVRLAHTSVQLTQEGVAFGTVAYMAPEQAQALPIDFRADLYALGVMLYEMATGQLPFAHDNPAVLLLQQLTALPPNPRQLNPAVDEPLEALILHLLAREPAERPASADWVAARLMALADEPASIPTPTSPSGRADLIPRIPLIGRRPILERLIQYWTSAQMGQGRLVLLSGTAGVGKTRLLDELSLQAQIGGGRWLKSYCREQTSLPYQPLIDLLDNLASDLPPAVRASLPSDLARILPSLATSDPTPIDAQGSGLTSANPSEARLRLFAACWDLLAQAAQLQPLMLAVEDSQWADPTTLELLSYLAQRIELTPILLLISHRPEEVLPDAPWAKLEHDLQRSRQVESVGLDPLDREQVSDFLQTALGRERIPAWLTQSFYVATGGNPLFIEETLKALATEGQVAVWADQETSQWANLATTTLQLPQTVLALAERRLQQLASEDRPLLTTAAVLGPEFSFDLLQTVSQVDEDTLLDVIERLLQARLIEELPLQAGEDRYRFNQEALRQALLKTVSGRRLRRMHQRTGQAIQELYDTSRPRFWPILAHHFSEAGDQPQALKYFDLAGDEAARVFAHVEAVAHYTHALEIATSLEASQTDERANQRLRDLSLKRGRTLELNSEFEAALDNYQDMVELARGREDPSLELAALLAQVTIRVTPNPVHDLVQGQELSARALRQAQALGDRQAEAKALWNLMLVNLRTGQLAETLAYGEQSLAIARELNLREQLAFTLNDLHAAYMLTGQPERGQAVLTEARALWRELNNMPMLADNLANATVGHFLTGDYEQALALADETVQISQSTENLWGQAHGLWVVGPIHFRFGDPDKAVAVMEDVVRLSDQGGLAAIQVDVRAHLAWVYGQLGAMEQALELGREAQLKAESLFPEWRPQATATLARLHLLHDDVAAAGAALQETQADLNPNSFAAITAGLASAELALAQQNYAEVISLIDHFMTRLQALGIRSFIPEGLHLKGQALLAQGQDEAAAEILAEARRRAEALNVRANLWPILLTLSQLEQTRGNVAVAETLRKQAREIVIYISDHISSRDLLASFQALPKVQKALAAKSFTD